MNKETEVLEGLPVARSVHPLHRNKQTALMLSSRGINHRMRHLMNDLEVLLPHVKKGVRFWDFSLLMTCSVVA